MTNLRQSIRKTKRRLLKCKGAHTEAAFGKGEHARRKTIRLPSYKPRNPYPPGVRHDEWERGFKGSDE
jgi:hypothetical protein